MKLDVQEFNEVNQGHAINYFAILFALYDRGVLTPGDWERAKAEATHFVDQAAAMLLEKHRRGDGD